jgi:hypothetical protein
VQLRLDRVLHWQTAILRDEEKAAMHDLVRSHYEETMALRDRLGLQ